MFQIRQVITTADKHLHLPMTEYLNNKTITVPKFTSPEKGWLGRDLIGSIQLKSTNDKSSSTELPMIVTVHTRYKRRHRFISTPSLQLIISALPFPTSTAPKLISRSFWWPTSFTVEQCFLLNFHILHLSFGASHLFRGQLQNPFRLHMP
ncbi:hypothetical protein Hanom_Chr14g01330741 [Helianthus anomalus]